VLDRGTPNATAAILTLPPAKRLEHELTPKPRATTRFQEVERRLGGRAQLPLVGNDPHRDASTVGIDPPAPRVRARV